MVYVLACLMASLSFLLNRAALRYAGFKTVITYSPVLEELAKTLLAFYLGADILVTHVLFGTIEAGYDLFTSERHGLAAGVMSIVGHGIFGLVTVAVLRLTGAVFPALCLGIIAHLAWNVTAIRLVE